jgi:hypothetical protein
MVRHPSHHQILTPAGQQDHLPIGALHEVKATAGIEGNGFSQNQGPPGSRRLAPAAEPKQPCENANECENADKADGDKPGCLGVHGRDRERARSVPPSGLRFDAEFAERCAERIFMAAKPLGTGIPLRRLGELRVELPRKAPGLM